MKHARFNYVTLNCLAPVIFDITIPFINLHYPFVIIIHLIIFAEANFYIWQTKCQYIIVGLLMRILLALFIVDTLRLFQNLSDI